MQGRDRSSINALHGISSGNGMMPIWNKEATPISPGENREDHSRSRKPHQSRNIVGGNPYSSNRLSTTLNGRSSNTAGNPVSKRTMLDLHTPRPTKRLKSDHELHRSSGGIGKSRDSAIPVDEEEDLGKRLVQSGSSPDPINLLPHPHPFDVVADGLHTKRLRGRMAVLTRDSDDMGADVQIISERDPVRPKEIAASFPQQGNVQHKIDLFEKEKSRRIDRMRNSSEVPKQVFRPSDIQRQKDPIATSSTSFTPSKNGRCFLVEAWYLGLKLSSDPNDATSPQYCLLWEGRKLILRRGPLGQPSPHSVDVMPDKHVYAATFSQPSNMSNTQVLQLKIGAPIGSANPPLWMTPSDTFNPGSHDADGLITIKFQAESHSTYTAFIKWLRSQVDDVSVVDRSGAKAIWEQAERAPELDSNSIPSHRKEAGRNPKAFSVIANAGPTAKKPRFSSTPDRTLDPPPKNIRDPTSSRIPNSERAPIPMTTIFTSRPKPRPTYEGAANRDAIPLEMPRRSNMQNIDASPSDMPRRSNKRNVDATPSEIPRRSIRQAAPQNTPAPFPMSDPDELILVFPPDSPGAVNITNGDLNRLRPGEFLNDTLIEFGLKLWLHELRAKDSEFAESIHVFSSFFYKKLNIKNLEEGYQSIRKWTAKIDIFKKKYIIVPINEHLHWYLAIIYQPEHVLCPPAVRQPSPIVSTRSRARASLPEPKPSENDQLDQQGEGTTSDSHQATTSETQEDDEVQVLENFPRSCSISVDEQSHEWLTGAENGVSVAEPEPIIVDDVPGNRLSYSSSISNFTDDPDVKRPRLRGKEPRISKYFSVRSPSRGQSTEPETDSSGQRTVGNVMEPDKNNSISGGIPPEQFYGSMGKRKAAPSATEIRDEEEEVVNLLRSSGSSAPEPPTQTYIFTLDSLGSRHPRVVTVLNNYLKSEAKDKRSLEDVSAATGKQALVPGQPNYCDCGIYLLHFVETFMTDPAHYCRTILSGKPSPDINERRIEWKGENIEGLREELTQRINDLSEKWKLDRAAKEEQRKKEVAEGKEVERVESSDDEIDIVEDLTAAKPSPAKQKPKRRKANRIR